MADMDYTPLHEAAYRGHLSIVKCLLEADNATLHSRTRIGSTPLHLAAQQGHLQVVDYLLSMGADANILNVVSHQKWPVRGVLNLF